MVTTAPLLLAPPLFGPLCRSLAIICGPAAWASADAAKTKLHTRLNNLFIGPHLKFVFLGSGTGGGAAASTVQMTSLTMQGHVVGQNGRMLISEEMDLGLSSELRFCKVKNTESSSGFS